MTDEHQSSDSVVAALGIDVDSGDAGVSDDLWQAMLGVAVDPSTPPADSSVVPVMDDSGDLPDDGAHDADLLSHDSHGLGVDLHTEHHGDDIVLEHDHDPGFGHHDGGADGSTPDHGGDHHHDQGDHDWHV